MRLIPAHGRDPARNRTEIRVRDTLPPRERVRQRNTLTNLPVSGVEL
jgi:hypothetical protein